MSIRLNKAIRELNIGLQTAVEFLEKRSDLGEVRSDLSFKLSDEQYEALAGQFKKDKEVKGMAEKLFPKHQKEKKKPAEQPKPAQVVTTPSEPRQQFKPLGKIDLNNLGKKAEPAKAEKKEEPKAAAVSPKPETKKETAAEKKEQPSKPTQPEKPAEITDVPAPKATETSPASRNPPLSRKNRPRKSLKCSR